MTPNQHPAPTPQDPNALGTPPQVEPIHQAAARIVLGHLRTVGEGLSEGIQSAQIAVNGLRAVSQARRADKAMERSGEHVKKAEGLRTAHERQQDVAQRVLESPVNSPGTSLSLNPHRPATRKEKKAAFKMAATERERAVKEGEANWLLQSNEQITHSGMASAGRFSGSQTTRGKFAIEGAERPLFEKLRPGESTYYFDRDIEPGKSFIPPELIGPYKPNDSYSGVLVPIKDLTKAGRAARNARYRKEYPAETFDGVKPGEEWQQLHLTYDDSLKDESSHSPGYWSRRGWGDRDDITFPDGIDAHGDHVDPLKHFQDNVNRMDSIGKADGIEHSTTRWDRRSWDKDKDRIEKELHHAHHLAHELHDAAHRDVEDTAAWNKRMDKATKQVDKHDKRLGKAATADTKREINIAKREVKRDAARKRRAEVRQTAAERRTAQQQLRAYNEALRAANDPNATATNTPPTPTTTGPQPQAATQTPKPTRAPQPAPSPDSAASRARARRQASPVRPAPRVYGNQPDVTTPYGPVSPASDPGPDLKYPDGTSVFGDPDADSSNS